MKPFQLGQGATADQEELARAKREAVAAALEFLRDAVPRLPLADAALEQMTAKALARLRESAPPAASTIHVSFNVSIRVE